MLKRLLWLTIGASFGFATSLWVVRALRQTVERYAPRRVTSGITIAVGSIGRALRSALADGRQAMHDKEAALRAELETHGLRSP